MDKVEYFRQYYKKNKEGIKKRTNKRYHDNSEAILEQERIKRLNRTPEEVEAKNAYLSKYYEAHREEASEKAKGYYQENAEAIKTRVKKYFKGLPEEERSRSFRLSVFRRFNTTEEWYVAKLAEQGGHCALCDCEREEYGNFLAIDHDHQCCKRSGSCGNCLRGLLCLKCNVLLGQLVKLVELGLVLGAEHSGWAAKAMKYLEHYKSGRV